MTTNKINNANVVLKHDLMFEVTKKFESIDEHRFLNSCLQGNYQRELFNEAKYYPIDVRNYASKQNVNVSKAYEELIELVTKYKETKLLYFPHISLYQFAHHVSSVTWYLI